MDVVAHAINVLSGSLLERNKEDSFKLLRKSNWDKIESVGDESPYVLRIKQALTSCVPTYRDILSASLFRQFCTRFASMFLDAYMKVILNLRKISVVGAEQLLLDTNR